MDRVKEMNIDDYDMNDGHEAYCLFLSVNPNAKNVVYDSLISDYGHEF